MKIPFYVYLLISCLTVLSCKTEIKETPKIVALSTIDTVFSPDSTFVVSKKLDSFIQKIKKGSYGFTNELFIAKNGKLLYQQTFTNNYNVISQNKKGALGCGFNTCADSTNINPYNYYHPQYHPYYKNTRLHTLQSITKSVTATVIGCALKRAELTNIQAPLASYFPEIVKKDSLLAAHLATTTIEDVLTMQLGLEWNEMTAPLDSTNDVVAMEKSKDWIAYIFSKKPDAATLKKWNYSSGASILLSEIIKQASGKTIDEYAEEVLFGKLGITNYHWKKIPGGLPDTEGGLYLSTKDLAKIGQLYLNEGMWDGEQLLTKQWIIEATSKKAKNIMGNNSNEGYGYQWWLPDTPNKVIVGLGFGNQILLIIPEKNVVGVVNSWNIFDNEGSYIFSDFLEQLMYL